MLYVVKYCQKWLHYLHTICTPQLNLSTSETRYLWNAPVVFWAFHNFSSLFLSLFELFWNVLQTLNLKCVYIPNKWIHLVSLIIKYQCLCCFQFNSYQNSLQITIILSYNLHIIPIFYQDCNNYIDNNDIYYHIHVTLSERMAKELASIKIKSLVKCQLYRPFLFPTLHNHTAAWQ